MKVQNRSRGCEQRARDSAGPHVVTHGCYSGVVAWTKEEVETLRTQCIKERVLFSLHRGLDKLMKLIRKTKELAGLCPSYTVLQGHLNISSCASKRLSKERIGNSQTPAMKSFAVGNPSTL